MLIKLFPNINISNNWLIHEYDYRAIRLHLIIKSYKVYNEFMSSEFFDP